MLTEKPRNAYWEIKGYRGRELLLHTWHTSEASKAAEVGAWQSRMKRGEATHIEVISFGKAETIYNS